MHQIKSTAKEIFGGAFLFSFKLELISDLKVEAVCGVSVLWSPAECLVTDTRIYLTEVKTYHGVYKDGSAVGVLCIDGISEIEREEGL